MVATRRRLVRTRMKKSAMMIVFGSSARCSTPAIKTPLSLGGAFLLKNSDPLTGTRHAWSIIVKKEKFIL